MKRYTLRLPLDLHQELATRAAAKGMVVGRLLLRIVQLDLWLARETALTPDAELLLRVLGEVITRMSFRNLFYGGNVK